MNKLSLLVVAIFSLLGHNLTAQVGIGTTNPSSSSQLEVSSTSKGLLIPRLALTGLNSASPISSPTTSLLVYNTATAGTAPNDVSPGYYYWTGSAWKRIEDQTTNPGSLHWNYVEGSPTQTGIGGTFDGNSSWQTGHVQLTSNNSSQNGKLYWTRDIDWSQPLHISMQTYAGGGTTGGDGIWLFFGANSNAIGASATHSTAAGGISIFLDEYQTEEVIVYKNGSVIGSLSPLTDLDNSRWQVQDFYFGKNPDGTRFIDIKLNNGEYIGTIELGSFTAAGDYAGVGAWTGSASNSHLLRRILIESGVHKPR